jgi:transcription elongation factor Elf1
MRNDVFDVPTKTSSIKAISDQKKEEKQKYTALCSNCDERFNCTIRNNTSIIWHCEEYK